MLQPPVSDLAPWAPGHWVTQTGYALNERDIAVVKNDKRQKDMLVSVLATDVIIKKVLGK